MLMLVAAQGMASNDKAMGLAAIDFYGAEAYEAHHQNWNIQRHFSGKLYVANNSGVLEFDGERWNNLTSPNLTFVYDLALTDTRIYVGSKNDLGYFQKNKIAQWQFYSLKNTLVAEAGEEPNIGQIYRVASTPIGVFFIGSNYLYHFQNDELKSIKLNRVSATYAMEWLNDQLFIGNSFGEIHRFDERTGTLNRIARGENSAQEVIMDFSPLRNGKSLFVSLDGLYLADTSRTELVLNTERFATEADSWMAQNSATTAIQLRNGNIAIGSRNAGIALIDSEGKLLKLIDSQTGLAQPRVTGMVEDDQQGLWVTHDGGISRLALEFGFYRFDNDPAFKNVETILSFNDAVYAGSRTRGLFTLSSTEQGRNSIFKPLFNYDAVWSLAGIEDTLFVGHGKGLDIYQTGGGDPTLSQRIDEVSPVYSVVEYEPATFFISHNLGVSRLQQNGARWVLSDLPLDLRIDHMVLASNSLWLGGLYQQYIRISNLENWPDVSVDNFSEESGIPLGPTDVISVNGDAAFVAEDGVLRFNPVPSTEQTAFFTLDPAFIHLRKDNDIQYPYPAHQLNDRTLIFAQNDELVFANRGSDGIYLTDNSVMKDDEYRRVNQVQSDENYIWVAADNGVYRFSRRAEFLQANPPTLIVNELITGFGQRVTSNLFDTVPSFGKANKVIRVPEPFPSDTTSVDILLTMSSFRSADNNQYRWKINDEWSEWTNDGVVRLDRLPRGTQTLTLQGKNINNVATAEIDFKFTILNFWYETWKFRVLIALAFFVLLFALVRFFTNRRTRKLEEEKQYLQLLVDEKTSELQIADAMKTQFFCNITHETRTPLTLNIGNIEHVLNDNPELDERVQRPLVQALSNAKRLLLLVNQILDINRYAAAEDKLDCKTYDINAFVGNIADRFLPLAKQRGIGLTINLLKSPLAVDFDAEKMERVLVNLLSNSFKFTHYEGHVTVTVQQDEGRAFVSVEDTGIGIPDDQLPHIFDRFYSNTKQQKLEYASSGIGLSIVKSIVEMHDGNIVAENQKPKGCRFTIRLPVSYSENLQDDFGKSFYTEEIVSVYQSKTSSGLRAIELNALDQELPDKKTILVIDDNEELRQFIVSVFGSDFLVFEAGNGKEGLDLARQYFPDLVICDLMMPVMDGIEFARYCKNDADLSAIPIFLLTANSTEELRSSGFEAGAIDFLEKPFQFREFKTKVHNFLNTQERLFERIRAEVKGLEVNNSVEALVNAESDPFVIKVTDYVREHIYEDISVESLAEQFNTDRSNLYRHIHKETNMSTQNFIKDIRLSVASELLIHTQDNVSTIAYKLGFNNLSYFTRSFKTKFSCTPNQFRSSKQ